MVVWELVQDAMQAAHLRGEEWLTVGEIVRKVHKKSPAVHPETIGLQVKYHCINDPSKRNAPGHQYRSNPLLVTDDPTKYGKSYRLLTEEERRAFLSNPRDDLDTFTYAGVMELLGRPGRAVGHPLPEQRTAAVPRAATRREATLERMRDRVDKLIAGFDKYMEAFSSSNPFTGPSLHFHLKALAVLQRHPAPSAVLHCDEFFDYLYATLTAWGMHRMGRGGAKLADLPEIKQSFLRQEQPIRELESVSISEILSLDIPSLTSKLWAILDGLRVGIGETKIVANSKALHHVLPEVVPPIDRAYTLRFFYNNTNLNRGDEVAFKEIYPHFHRVAVACQEQIQRHLGSGPWNTSQTKVIDNAIVGFVSEHLKGKPTARRKLPI